MSAARVASLRHRAQQELFTALVDHVPRLTWDAPTLHAFQTKRLRTLLAHAIEHSPFHRERLGGVDPAAFECADLSSLPIMEKPDMMGRFDDVVTDRRLRRDDLERLIAATGDEPTPASGDHWVLTSGGSSGTRGLFVLDVRSAAEFYASVMRPSFAAMMDEQPAARDTRPMAVIAASSPIHATGLSTYLLEGGPASVTAIPATLPFEEVVGRVHALDPGSVLGYPSVIAGLAAAQLEGRLAIRPSRVTTTSENLVPEVRSAIERAFGVPVVDTFGSSEGLVGASPPGDDVLTFASDCCLVELVDEHDEPVGRGQPAASILVTNLFNLSQPLIRYRMEDRFIEQPPAQDHGHLRAIVDGRNSEILRWDDVVVHPVTIANELLVTPAVTDYVIRQTRPGLDIDVVADSTIEVDVLCQRIAEALAMAGLPGAEVAVRVIDHVARDARTGKAARIIPLDRAR